MAKEKAGARSRRGWGQIRQMGSGRYQASYVAQNGLRYNAPSSFDTKTDAEGWLASERRLIQLDAWTPPNERSQAKTARQTTLHEFATTWLAERDIGPKTRALYRDLLNSRILPTLGDEKLTDITPALVRTWWASLGKTTSTRNAQAYNLLKSILTTAVGDKLLPENPCTIPGAGKQPKGREIDILTVDELAQVEALVTERYRVAIPVTAWCGLRFGELIELRRKDIADDGERMVLKIRRAATLVDNKIVVGLPKTDAGTRDIHVPPHVAEKLREHLKRQTARGPENFVFTTNQGKRLSASTFTKQYKSAVAAVGKPELRVHDLRHVGAVLAARAGATTKELMSRLGHTTPAMSMRYQHASADRDAAIARALSKLAEG